VLESIEKSFIVVSSHKYCKPMNSCWWP